MLEKEIYAPIKTYFERKGYEVKAEVINTDIIAKKESNLVAIEMKTSLSMKVIYQALNRKGITQDVYIAVPFIKNLKKDVRYLIYIMKRLELGLLFVHSHGYVECLVEPSTCTVLPLKSSKKRELYHTKEFDGRSLDGNIAGSTGVKQLTAYKEKAIRIACIMRKYGEITPKRLRDEFGMDKSTYGVMRDNFYKWFYSKERGVYGVTAQGLSEILEYEELIEIIEKDS